MAILEHINGQISDFKNFIKKGEKVTISDYLDEHLVTFLDVPTRDDALKKLVNVLDTEGKLFDQESFFQAILSREKIVSTGVGMGVAIPHAKLQGYPHFFIAIGIQARQGIEWNALDGLPVRLIFMIGGPENRPTEYLKILSWLTLAIKDEERRKKLLKATKPAEVIALFTNC